MLTRRAFLKNSTFAVAAVSAQGGTRAQRGMRPKIVWLLAEDASPHIACYRETIIKTPHLDALAAEGIRFDAAFATCPVCSPSRAALITGMYQPTLGAHNHRSQCQDGKGMGGPAYFDSDKVPVKLIPQLFREAAYYVTNGSGPACNKAGKTDYNFLWDEAATYDGADWREAPAGKPFFAQDHTPLEAIFAARDRCDETPEIIRCVRTKRYKYIRNFMAHCSHMQPNQYKDGKEITKTMRALFAEGKRNEFQGRIFQPTRPPEEHYDVVEYPYETVNLAGDPSRAETLATLREQLYAWLEESRDLGLIPEPVLEEWGKTQGNQYYVFQHMPEKVMRESHIVA